MDTGTTLRIVFQQLPMYSGYPGSIMWKLTWVLILHYGQTGHGHMAAGSSLRSVCSYPRGYLFCPRSNVQGPPEYWNLLVLVLVLLRQPNRKSIYPGMSSD